MSRYFEADRNTLLNLGLLSANVHSVLFKIAKKKPATPEQRRIVKNAVILTKNITAGKIAKPKHDEFLALPSPGAAKVRTFAIRAWKNVVPTLRNGQRESSNFDQIMEDYLELFNQVEKTGTWAPDKNEIATQAMFFFATLNQVVVDNLNGLVEEETPALAEYQTA